MSASSRLQFIPHHPIQVHPLRIDHRRPHPTPRAAPRTPGTRAGAPRPARRRPASKAIQGVEFQDRRQIQRFNQRRRGRAMPPLEPARLPHHPAARRVAFASRTRTSSSAKYASPGTPAAAWAFSTSCARRHSGYLFQSALTRAIISGIRSGSRIEQTYQNRRGRGKGGGGADFAANHRDAFAARLGSAEMFLSGRWPSMFASTTMYVPPAPGRPS